MIAETNTVFSVIFQNITHNIVILLSVKPALWHHLLAALQEVSGVPESHC